MKVWVVEGRFTNPDLWFPIASHPLGIPLYPAFLKYWFDEIRVIQKEKSH